MPVYPSWPSGVPYAPDLPSMSIEPVRPPIRTEMQSANVRQRARPGDNVAIITQTVRMNTTQFNTFFNWARNNGLGSGRFTMNVRIGGVFVSKTCQFEGGMPPWKAVGTRDFDVTMKLRVYGV